MIDPLSYDQFHCFIAVIPYEPLVDHVAAVRPEIPKRGESALRSSAASLTGEVHRRYVSSDQRAPGYVCCFFLVDYTTQFYKEL